MTLRGRFRRCISGNVGMIFALAIIPLVLAAGMAIDMVRINQVKSVLQAAADAAALGGGASTRPTEAEIIQIAQNYIDMSNTAEVVSELKDVVITNDAATGAFKVEFVGTMPTSFMHLAGINSVDIPVFSEVTRGSGAPLELVLALDNTASMSGTKMDTLKIAAKNLAAMVLEAGGDAKVGIVPFNDYVNVGLDKRGESWLTIGAESSYPYCYNSYPNRTQCTQTSSTCYSDGIPYTCYGETCADMGDPVEHCSTYTNAWAGCVASREPPYNTRIDNAIVNNYDGLVNYWCSRAITDLTDVKADVTVAIDAMYTSGNTFIPGGLLWGWNMLNADAPLTTAMTNAEMNDARGKKALVLMTDGANTLYESSNGATWGVHWSCPDATYCDTTNALTADLCTNIKADGILIYTVLFDVTDPAIQDLLRNCATDPSMSYVASDNAALLSAFNGIGSSLSQLRLSK